MKGRIVFSLIALLICISFTNYQPTEAVSGQVVIYLPLVMRSGTWLPVGTGSASDGGISDNSGYSGFPALAIAPNGMPYAVWEDASNGNNEIYARAWNGSHWEEVGIGSASGGGISNTPGRSQVPDIAIAPDGTPYVTWVDSTNGYEIYVRAWNGNSWAEVGPGSANGGGISNNPGLSNNPAIAIAPDGTVYVAWDDSTDAVYGNNHIYVLAWNGSSWGEVGTGSASGGGISNGGYAARASVAVALDGTPYVTWQDDSNIYLRVWNGSSWIELGGSGSGGGISNNGLSVLASIAIAPDGTPYVAWQSFIDSNNEVYVRFWDGSSWAEVGPGSASGGGISNNSGYSGHPSIAVSPNGTPYIAWADSSTPGEWEIYVRMWNGSNWAEVGTGSASGGGISNSLVQAQFPSLAIDLNGIPYIIWVDGTNYPDHEIYAMRYFD